jgi:hypothetical protein
VYAWPRNQPETTFVRYGDMDVLTVIDLRIANRIFHVHHLTCVASTETWNKAEEGRSRSGKVMNKARVKERGYQYLINISLPSRSASH